MTRNHITAAGLAICRLRIVASGLDSGESVEATAKRLDCTAKEVESMRVDFLALGWPKKRARDILDEAMGMK